MRGLQFFAFFACSFNKFNNGGARTLGSSSHMHFRRGSFNICHIFAASAISKRYHNVLFTSGISILIHHIISLPDATSCDTF